ncbi:hypothetical protein SSX86_013280 [Deinandra increscens subsp. villosa]|uniref:HMA domain-containing protein n=1 Tax=Deinandra increscens subsp. villosa TaxID=3103831 RepID=A0AAP0H1M8_9ASTR
MKLKTTELFCASPASTAICTAMNHHAMVRRGSTSTPRPITHRHHDYYNNHYQFDFGDKPKFKVPTIPCTSQQHIDPKPYLQKPRKTISAIGKVKDNDVTLRRKSNADVDERKYSGSRYVLNNPIFVADLKDGDHGVCNAGALVVSEPAWPAYRDDTPVMKKCSSARRLRGEDGSVVMGERRSSSLVRVDAKGESPGLKGSRSRARDQVVELRVSIHCKGCAGKVKKHLSRMEGVTSFHIDLESKKVTVVGDVTPLSVLSSISKVKNAQLWPSSGSSSSSPYIAIGY